jgi:Uma2 family endonuclease
MSTVFRSKTPPLVPGQRLTQADFHRRYELCPENEKWELVGGIVYKTPPIQYLHGQYHADLGGALGVYQAATPGVVVVNNATTIMGEKSEPQPDLSARIVPECGGQARVNERLYLEGAPELVAEVSHGTRELDVKHKRRDYERAGVLEYLVLSVDDQQLHWLPFPSGQRIGPDRQGIVQSRVLPGLWIHHTALLANDSARLLAVVQQGLTSRAHAAFVKRLQAERKRRSRG